MNEIIMQGTVWGSLFCTVSIDQLGKKAYAMPDILYNYKGVQIPPLGMVDDKCGKHSMYEPNSEHIYRDQEIKAVKAEMF